MAGMKILFITSTRLGDAILSTGLLDHLLKTKPEARVTVLCGPLPASIFEGFPNVERIIPLKKRRYSLHWLDAWKAVYKTPWAQVIDLRNSALSRIIGAKERFIFGAHIDSQKHKVEQAADVLKLSSVPAPKLYFTPEQKAFARGLINPDGRLVLAVGPTANWIGKTWPAQNFIEVLHWMISQDGPAIGARVAVFAAPDEAVQAKVVLEAMPESARIDGIGKGTPGEVAAAISLCDFYIGNDSGLMHAAAAAHVPTLGLFGPSYPHLYAPWGDHTGYIQTPQTYDELIDFKGYDPKTLDRSLMDGLKANQIIDIIKKFEPFYDRLSQYIAKTNRAGHEG
jgi:heptosyltransferase III